MTVFGVLAEKILGINARRAQELDEAVLRAGDVKRELEADAIRDAASKKWNCGVDVRIFGVDGEKHCRSTAWSAEAPVESGGPAKRQRTS